ncbi:hypothetical protein RND81_03G058800 [Saponaria officinalis]|uniref:Cytochrome P450 n=1 Tax=Saponaria officinalis TaxID=3572 RepID=A0AAW1LYE9_SAPOF
MAPSFSNEHILWWLYSLPTIVTLDDISTNITYWASFTIGLFFCFGLMAWAISPPGGPTWSNWRNQMARVAILGPRGLPIFGSLFTLSRGLTHRTLDCMAQTRAAHKPFMRLSLGSTPLVFTSDPEVAREILTSPHFADRPIKQSAKQLMFSRAIGFAPSGAYWRLLRKIAASHLFVPKRISAHEGAHMSAYASMINLIFKEQSLHGLVSLRKHLQKASLNIMGNVFGKTYDLTNENINQEFKELHELVKEGFELLGAFNWSDHLTWLENIYDPCRVVHRCSKLVPQVQNFVRNIIYEHRNHRMNRNDSSENFDFVDVLLSLDGEEKLAEDDMIGVLWEMIFRGTDTIALTIEWIIAELILNPTMQSKLQNEIDKAIIDGPTISSIARLPYLQAVVKETLRLHTPGPLLSWARLSTTDVHLARGMVVPLGTTTMINMWSITHDPNVWDEPLVFKPERFVESEGGIDVDIRGSDL